MTILPVKISVVIPTFNRSQAVIDLVHDLLKQDMSEFDIIVVDQTSEENIALIEIASQNPCLKVLRPETVGTCHARNVGVAAAVGDVIVFFDDDCRVDDRSLLAKHVKNYIDDSVGGVAGRVIDKNLVVNREQSGRVCWVTATGKIYGSAMSTVRQDVNAPRGAHMSFRRTVIDQVGGWDEQFRGNAMREETDFSLRAVRSGWRIVYDPSVTVQHLGLLGGSRSANRLRWYDDFFFNESYFFLKHFPTWYVPILIVRKARAIVACWLWYGRGRAAWFISPWKAWRQAWVVVHKQI